MYDFFVCNASLLCKRNVTKCLFLVFEGEDAPLLYNLGVTECLLFVFEGQGSVTVDRIVSDNRWHLLEWSRKYREIFLVLDSTERGESVTPGKEILLNIARSEEIFVNISSPIREGISFRN